MLEHVEITLDFCRLACVGMDFDQLYKEGTVVEVQYETNGQWVLGIVTNGNSL